MRFLLPAPLRDCEMLFYGGTERRVYHGEIMVGSESYQVLTIVISRVLAVGTELSTVFTPLFSTSPTSRPCVGIHQCEQLFELGYILYSTVQCCQECLFFALVRSTFDWAIRDFERNSTRTITQLQGHLQESFVD